MPFLSLPFWRIQTLLLTYMPTISNILASRLFDDYGPLNSLAAKIYLAPPLDLIDVETYTDLRAIQAIRNTFAHPTDRLAIRCGFDPSSPRHQWTDKTH
jgi:hypothetical protein